MVHDILFKFAVDSSNLFGGSDWAAAKVFFFVCVLIFCSDTLFLFQIANHELNGLMTYFSLDLEGYSFVIPFLSCFLSEPQQKK